MVADFNPKIKQINENQHRHNYRKIHIIIKTVIPLIHPQNPFMVISALSHFSEPSAAKGRHKAKERHAYKR